MKSPFFFNVFYEDLIDRLQSCKYGVNISGVRLNTICYADDILLCSASVSGLQKLINIATEYIISHGLRFNPVKTVCMIKGPNPFTTTPQWNMDGVALKLEDTITYLGTTIGDKTGKVHTDNRSRAASRSFYGLQGAGIKFPGVEPMLSLEMYKMAVQSTMLYGCATIYMSKMRLQVLNKLQSKLVKQCLGLHKWSRTSPLLKSMNMESISTIVKRKSLDLLKSCLFNTSLCKDFYFEILNSPELKKHSSRTLLGRVTEYLNDNDIDVISYMFNKDYCN